LFPHDWTPSRAELMLENRQSLPMVSTVSTLTVWNLKEKGIFFGKSEDDLEMGQR
jgi:hypothetical protein